MDLMYICSIFYHEVLLASMFTNLHNSKHLKYFIPQYSPLFQNKAKNPTRVNPGLPSGLTRVEMGTSNPGKYRDCTIRVAKTKALISFAVTSKLICVFVFAYSKCWFSHDVAQIVMIHLRGDDTCRRHSVGEFIGKE